MPSKTSVDVALNRLKIFMFHGIDLEVKEGTNKAVSEVCPFCGHDDGKFSISTETTKFGCWSCKVTGNDGSFLDVLHGKSLETTSEGDYEKLREGRKLLYADTLRAWGVCKSVVDGTWLVPGYDQNGKLIQLYRYSKNGKTGKYLLYAAPDSVHGLFGVPLFDERKEGQTVYLAEGPWDGMALWEGMTIAKYGSSGLVMTGSSEHSLLSKASVLALPGCNVFHDGWVRFLTDRNVVLCFDNDHPKPNPKTKTVIPPAGYEGVIRLTKVLAGMNGEQPEAVSYVSWGDNGYTLDLPSGTDLRDVLGKAGDSLQDRVNCLGEILDKIKPASEDWVPSVKKNRKTGSVEVEPVPCADWKQLVQAWRKAMKWTDGLDRGLSASLACAMSTLMPGDPLWMKCVGPASSGKSTLCEALAVSKKHVKSVSKLRGMHSGYLSDKEGDEDHSLLKQCLNKTLVIKDADTLLTTPNLAETLSELRDIYDGVSRTHYRHGKGREYEGIKLTVILYGTSSLRLLDQSELGQRFLDVVIVEDMPEEMERTINQRKINQIRKMMESGGDGSGRDGESPDMVLAKQLTGGYVEYLCRDYKRLLSRITLSDEAAEYIDSLGQFVAFMRARPSKKQDEEYHREFSTRLVSQLLRMAYCTAVVLQRSSIDQEVLRRVCMTGLDTARGRMLDLLRVIARCGEKGALPSALLAWTNETDTTLRHLLKFMKRINVVETFEAGGKGMLAPKVRYRLTERLSRLYAAVEGDSLETGQNGVADHPEA